MMRILIVDDHPIVRRGIRNILEVEMRNVEIGEASTGEEAVAAIRREPWDVVLLDLGLPDRPGLEVLAVSRRERPDLPVLILTMHDEESYAIRVLRAGAAGYLTKESAPAELASAVGRVARGGRYISASLAERLASHLGALSDTPPHESLSDREFQVFCLMAKGVSLTEIARGLTLSIKTVSTHRAHILQKMGLQNNAELVHYAVRYKLIV
jgi:two-component system, NarL family, invasion response regulator UvrY